MYGCVIAAGGEERVFAVEGDLAQRLLVVAGKVKRKHQLMALITIDNRP